MDEQGETGGEPEAGSSFKIYKRAGKKIRKEG